MENATEAILMAGSVLLFVLALSIVVPLFGQARATADTVLSYSDRESDYYALGEDYENDFFYTGTGDEANRLRYVSLDTIIPAIYRSYKENTKIVFTEKTEDGVKPYTLYRYKKNGVMQELNSIDLKYTSISAGSEKTFIDGIVYGDFSKVTKQSNIETEEEAFKRTFGVELISNKVGNGTGVYDLLKAKIDGGKKIKEYLGVYYQEDITNDDPENRVPEANKDEKRVITYEIQ